MSVWQRGYQETRGQSAVGRELCSHGKFFALNLSQRNPAKELAQAALRSPWNSSFLIQSSNMKSRMATSPSEVICAGSKAFHLTGILLTVKPAGRQSHAGQEKEAMAECNPTVCTHVNRPVFAVRLSTPQDGLINSHRCGICILQALPRLYKLVLSSWGFLAIKATLSNHNHRIESPHNGRSKSRISHRQGQQQHSTTGQQDATVFCSWPR